MSVICLLCPLFRLYSCLIWFVVFFFFKQKTAYEMRISDWSSDVCSSDLRRGDHICAGRGGPCSACWGSSKPGLLAGRLVGSQKPLPLIAYSRRAGKKVGLPPSGVFSRNTLKWRKLTHLPMRSEEHTSELQSLMRISYAVFCLKKKKK